MREGGQGGEGEQRAVGGQRGEQPAGEGVRHERGRVHDAGGEHAAREDRRLVRRAREHVPLAARAGRAERHAFGQLVDDARREARRVRDDAIRLRAERDFSNIRRAPVEHEAALFRAAPRLGDIPLLGAAFTSAEKAKSLVELVMFITPVVVDNPDENDTNFNVEERKRLDELSKPLEEMVKELGGDEFFDQIDDDQTSPEAGKTDEPATSGE